MNARTFEILTAQAALYAANVASDPNHPLWGMWLQRTMDCLRCTA